MGLNIIFHILSIQFIFINDITMITLKNNSFKSLKQLIKILVYQKKIEKNIN